MKDWKDKVIESVNPKSRAKPPHDTFDKILNRIHDEQERTRPNRQWVAIAASIALIVASNIFMLTSTRQEISTNDNIYEEIISDYNIYADDN
ncbi:hypothetical protein AAGF08_19440 [Algoriphagus sp. SE2]|uniref:hypothetical protein n=1 Tax=Algoriphagus sp. SE2 TaxID=3141536 RepID=UPI0031CCEC7F